MKLLSNGIYNIQWYCITAVLQQQMHKINETFFVYQTKKLCVVWLENLKVDCDSL